MKKYAISLLSILCLICSLSPAFAGQLKVYVGEFMVTGSQNKEELRGALQTLLSTRLNSDRILAVESAASADITVNGSYITFGKVYSLDATARDKAGKVVTRAFEQGEDFNQMIPTIGKLADKLSADLAKLPIREAQQPVAVIAAPPADLVRKQAAPAPLPEPEIVRPQTIEKTTGSGWISQRLSGALLGIAPGRTLDKGERELFVADGHGLKLYRQGEQLKLVAEVNFKTDEQVLGVDTAEPGADGGSEAYVTIMRGDALASQVWAVNGDSLVKVAEKLPYFFRGIAVAGGNRKIYAQEMGSGGEYYGDVQEVVKSGKGYELKNPIKLPRFGNIYNFNMIAGPQGKDYYVVINDDGYLIVYGLDMEELWRSSDKFGGSEAYFKQEDLANVRITGNSYRWKFLQQRITATREGDILVPQNSGTFVIGDQRAYKKNSVYSFAWNGSSLDEKWHTKESQNYLADYFFDNARKELLLLQVVKKDGLFSAGASTIAVKRVE